MDHHHMTPEVERGQTVIKVRCPSCFKLYAVEENEIVESKPQFQCVKCQTRFWFPYPECLEQAELLGFPVAWLEEQGPTSSAAPGLVAGPAGSAAPKPALEAVEAVRQFHCPRCEALYKSGDPECPKCGVVFAKLDFVDPQAVPASSHLKKLWRQVMDSYESIESHRRFVQACQKENNLPFASHQYRRLLSAHAGDEMALRMQKEIAALSEVVSGLANKPVRQSWSLRLLPKVTTLIMVLGGAMIGLGAMIPAARNLIGLGVAVVFFMIALEWAFRRSV